MADAEDEVGQRGLRPVPDPTILTTQQLNREIGMLKEILETRIRASEKSISDIKTTIDHLVPKRIDETASCSDRVNAERFEAINERFQQHVRANEQSLHEVKELIVSVVDMIKTSRGETRSYYDERFKFIDSKFEDVKTAAERTFRDSKTAIDAAFIAAKDAVEIQNKNNNLATTKSEAAFSKQIDQLNTTISTVHTAVSDKIDDVKNRLNVLEGTTKAGEGHGRGVADMWVWIIGGVGMFATIITLLFMLMGERERPLVGRTGAIETPIYNDIA